MSELKMGDRVRILNGGECKVLAKLGEGGQGIVYKVSYEGKEMALKWYFIEKMKNPKHLLRHMKQQIRTRFRTSSQLMLMMYFLQCSLLQTMRQSHRICLMKISVLQCQLPC